MTLVIKTAILMFGMIATAWAGYYLAYERKNYQWTGQALLFVNILIFGASIFLVAQIYHLPLTFWWGALIWFTGAALFAYILQSKLHLWLSVPLFLLFLGWLKTYGATGFASEFNFLAGGRDTIFSLFPFLGVGILSLGILHRKHPNLQFGESTLFHWGIFLTLLMFVVSTADKEVLFNYMRLPMDSIGISVLVGSLLAFLVAVIFGEYLTKEGRWGLMALSLYVAFIHVLAYAPRWLGFPLQPDYYGGGYNFYLTDVPLFKGLFVIHVILVVVLLLTVVWYGTLLKMPAVINMGMLGLAITIFIQYFSWAFEMLDRSLAFILGGVLILALSAVLERKRRQILTTMKQ